MIAVVVLANAGLGGCFWHAAEPDYAVGSIKDSPAPRRTVPLQAIQERSATAKLAAKRSVAPAAEAGTPVKSASGEQRAAGETAPLAPRPNISATSRSSEPARAPAQPAVANPTAPVATSTPDEPNANFARLLAEGRQLFDKGKVIEARKRIIAALNGLSPNATLALARTFDTHYLSKLPSSDGAPDMQRALQLYQSAVDRGATDANADLERIRQTLGLQPK